MWIWFLLAVLLAGGPVWGFSFSSSWQRSESKGTPPQWIQNYTFSFSRSLTHALSTGGSVRYSHQSQADTWRKTWTPSIYFSIANDLFSFNLSGTGTQSETESTPAMKSHSWSANLSTSYREVSIGLYFNYNRQWNEAHPRTVDSRSNGWGFSLARSFDKGLLANLSVNYDFRIDRSEDLIAGSESRSDAQAVRMSYSNIFHGLSFSLSHQYYISTSEADYTLGAGGRARAYVDLSFNGTPPGTLYPGTTSTDNNTLVILGPQQEIQGLELYIDWTNRKAVSGTSGWDIEYSSDGVHWTRITSNVSLPYQFSSPVKARYFRLILVSGSPVQLIDPHVRGFYFVTETHTESKLTHYQGNLSLSYNFPREIHTSYFFSYDISKPDTGSETKRFNHSLSASWDPSRYFRPRMTVSYYTDQTGNKPDQESRSYSLGISSDPLDTVTLSGAYTYNKSWTGGDPVSQSESYSLGVQMELYPDLILKTNAGYSETRSFGNATSLTRSYTTSLDLLARLRPDVTLDLRTDYTRSKPSGGEVTTSKRYQASVSWRISSILFFSTYHTITDSGQQKVYNYSYSFSLAPTSKVRVSGSWGGSRNGAKSDTLSANLTWNLGPHLNLNTSYSWSKSDTETSWSWFLNLSLVF